MSRRCLIVIVVIANVLLAAGLFLAAGLAPFIRAQLREQISLAGTRTRLYPDFVNQSLRISVYKRFKFFNITNLDDVIAGTSVPRLDEVGPYVYRRIRVRGEDHIAWHANGTVQYRWTERYVFEPTLGRPCTDVITTIRVGVLFAFQTTAATDFDPTKKAIFYDAAALSIKSIFVNKTVDELVRGYVDPFMKEINEHPVIAIAPDEPLTPPSEVYSGGPASATQPSVPPRDLGEFSMWKGHRDLAHYWDTPETIQIRGTDGTMYAPDLRAVHTITAFVESLRRPVDLDFLGDADYHGIPTRRYSPRVGSFSPSAAHRGFHIVQEGFMPRPPVRNVPDADIYGCIVKTNFLHTNMSGVKVALPDAPVAERDDTHLEFEPHSAMVMRVRKRSMLVMRLRPMVFPAFGAPTTLQSTANLNATWCPVMDECEELDMPPVIRDQIKREVVMPLRLAVPLGVTLAVLALVLQLAAVRKFCTQGSEDGETGSDGDGNARRYAVKQD